jgi:uncharacterized protein (TIGR02145 family)
MSKKIQFSVCLPVISGLILFLISSCEKNTGNSDINPSVPVTDIDGNVYKTVTIGTQVWMRENLRVTRYRNGDVIPNVYDGGQWVALTTGAYATYGNISNEPATYGRLYNWYAVSDPRNIAPDGWHVPTEAEWTTLNNFLGVQSTGGMMKEREYDHWEYPNKGATNSSGFTALPGGFRMNSGAGSYEGLGNFACMWSSGVDPNYLPYGFLLTYFTTEMTHDKTPATYGMSVRCIKDQ